MLFDCELLCLIYRVVLFGCFDLFFCVCSFVLCLWFLLFFGLCVSEKHSWLCLCLIVDFFKHDHSYF